MGEHLNEVKWIEKLPGAGGDWGRGVVGTVRELESAVDDAEGEKDELDRQLADVQAQVKAKKAEVNAAIVAKKKLLRSTLKRADDEAGLMFANAQIVAAREAHRTNSSSAEPRHEKAEGYDDGSAHAE